MINHDASSAANRRDDGFALLLPVYAGDKAEFLKLAFDSCVLDQTMPPSEVILVLDGPVTDELNGVIAGLRRSSPVHINLVELPENKGLGEALNVGLIASKFNVIARMDADDVAMPDRFERQWALINEGYELVGTGMVEFENDPDITGTVRVPPVGAEQIRNHARTHNPFNHPTVMYRLSAVESVGAYEPFGKMEDYWLWVRMLGAGIRAENIADPLVKYRVGSGAFARRGGFGEAMTEIKLQGAMRKRRFITFGQYLRNVVMKGLYRLLPAKLKRILFSKLIARGLPSEKQN